MAKIQKKKNIQICSLTRKKKRKQEENKKKTHLIETLFVIIFSTQQPKSFDEQLRGNSNYRKEFKETGGKGREKGERKEPIRGGGGEGKGEGGGTKRS